MVTVTETTGKNHCYGCGAAQVVRAYETVGTKPVEVSIDAQILRKTVSEQSPESIADYQGKPCPRGFIWNPQ